MITSPAEETHWTDAQVRWTAANHNLNNDDDDHGENDAGDDSSHSSIFEPSPTQEFSHPFKLKNEDTTTSFRIRLQGYEEDSDTIYVSTGLTLWRSSELLGEYMVGEDGVAAIRKCLRNNHGNIRILELGSGLGLAGILAHQVVTHQLQQIQQDAVIPTKLVVPSPSLVVLSDGDINALAVLRRNVEANIETASHDEPAESSASSHHHCGLLVEQLLWGKATTESFLHRHGYQLNSNDGKSRDANNKNDGKFDIILAADAIYVQANVKPLLETVAMTLRRPLGQFWFSYCVRRQVSVSIDDVLAEALSVGLASQKVSDDDDILVYVFTWRGTEGEA